MKHAKHLNTEKFFKGHVLLFLCSKPTMTCQQAKLFSIKTGGEDARQHAVFAVLSSVSHSLNYGNVATNAHPIYTPR